MKEELYNHFNKFISLDKKDMPKILSYFEHKTLKKKEILLEIGKKCTSNYFIAKGCIHMFFVNEKGTEQTIQFAIENWWLTDYLAFEQQSTTDFCIQAVENSEVLAIDYRNQQELFAVFPKLETYFRIVYQKSYGASLMRVKYMFDYSKEEIFFEFRRQFPDFVKRVPQYLLATYLGLTPEYLSQLINKRT
ncbi:Crp/Fnr family transcriptional regulator [Bernardetia sp. Wsw4-3y2]|uniref:Crp/Fnr family transcriptional regulator n=1 Tax=Bernardetia sp. Wsw4-3y2 TaxID=3127471 RepID=UPI0030D54289